MQLICLGTTGYHPNEHRHTACYLLPEVGVMLDAGSGVFRLADHLATDSLQIFLSHAHLDHVTGLTYLVETFGLDAFDRVTIHGVPDKLDSVRQHLFAPDIFPVVPNYQFAPLTNSCKLPANAAGDEGTLTTFPLEHPGGSIGMRLDWPGHSLAYVTDTTAKPDVDYIEKIRGIDLLLHEANFPNGFPNEAKLTGHSCLGETVAVAKAADVKRLVVIHLDPLLSRQGDFDLTEARKSFPEVQIAHDLDRFDF